MPILFGALKPDAGQIGAQQEAAKAFDEEARRVAGNATNVYEAVRKTEKALEVIQWVLLPAAIIQQGAKLVAVAMVKAAAEAAAEGVAEEVAQAAMTAAARRAGAETAARYFVTQVGMLGAGVALPEALDRLGFSPETRQKIAAGMLLFQALSLLAGREGRIKAAETNAVRAADAELQTAKVATGRTSQIEAAAQRESRLTEQAKKLEQVYDDTPPPVQEKIGRAASSLVGAVREFKVAKIVKGRVSGEVVTDPTWGTTDIDVVAENGDLVVAGGPKKASSAEQLDNMERSLRVILNIASRRRVGVQAYFTSDTPQSAIDRAASVVGKDRVHTF